MRRTPKLTRTMNSAVLRMARAPGLFLCIAAVLSWSGGAGGQEPAVPALTATQVVEKPELLHARLLAANPGYAGHAEFFQDQDMGLVGDLSSDPVIADLSPLRDIPFNALDLRGLAVVDLAPLKVMPLKVLCLEGTLVTDLAPLKGMKLEKLYLNDTAVRDLAPLLGMPLTEIILIGTRIDSLAPLNGAPLQSLWLNGLPVTDISPLAKSPLVSLTLEGTRVSDLGALSGMTSLQRLHVGGTPVTDLTPLKDLRLTRLIFTPATVKKGLDGIRAMGTITELGVTLEGRMPPEQFWALHDQGKLK
jgi:internalin A